MKKLSDFQILSLEDFFKDYANGTKRINQYYLFLFRKGKGSIAVDFFEHQVTHNIIWFIARGRAIQVNVTEFEGCVVRFSDTFLDLNANENKESFRSILYHYFCHSPFFEPGEQELAQFQHLFNEMQQEYNRNNSSRILLQSYLKIVLINYQRGIKPNSKNYQENTTNTIIILRSNIEQHYIAYKKASFYAEKQYLSLKRLNEIATSGIGKTVTQLLHERIILEAKRRLLFTSLSVSQIAYQLGYEDVDYFYRFFKKNVGCTATHFRNSGK
ncbi:helix-turn-helix domain-containing protein [Aquimarina sp. U1-2]|uniref:helix-turn-helix domain-containing protein n=1 Tax=Aquimarina sp. U1-2 TaxID=2823141 RepID=UPI001AEC94E8|nr:helix-turn-helix domain-containing protein [Aquimarina sp. U1-2]MBP2831842.1 helix-turn-helix domain-containing protein [Aquimarina sp. U1-2]